MGAGLVESAGVSVGAGFVVGVSWAKTAVESSRRTAEKGSVDGSTNSTSALPQQLLSPAPPLVPPFNKHTRKYTNARGIGCARCPQRRQRPARSHAYADGEPWRSTIRAPSGRPDLPRSVSPMEAVRTVGGKVARRRKQGGAKEKKGRGRVEKTHGRQFTPLQKHFARGAHPTAPPRISTHAAPRTRRARKRRSPLSWGL